MEHSINKILKKEPRNQSYQTANRTQRNSTRTFDIPSTTNIICTENCESSWGSNNENA